MTGISDTLQYQHPLQKITLVVRNLININIDILIVWRNMVFGFGNKFKKQGVKLVRRAKIISVPLMVPALDASEDLKQMNFKSNDWDFFTTIAIVWLGLTLNNRTLTESESKKLELEAVKNLKIMDKQADAAFIELDKYIYQALSDPSDGEEYYRRLGCWVLMNLKKSSQLNEAEIKLGYSLACSCFSQINNWWKST